MLNLPFVRVVTPPAASYISQNFLVGFNCPGRGGVCVGVSGIDVSCLYIYNNVYYCIVALFRSRTPHPLWIAG